MSAAMEKKRPKRPWRIEYRYSKHTSNGGKAPWTPWYEHRSRFATREAAEEMALGDFGYYLSFAAAHEYRIVRSARDA